MGNAGSTVVDHHSTSVVKKTELSEIYVACSNNDVDLVGALLETTPFKEINTTEINGSTALHCAVKFGYTNIVRLLLHDFEVCRHRLDSQGHTAYELVQTDDMRQFFRRLSGAGSRCFSDTVSAEQCTFIDSAQNDQVPNGRVDGQPYFLELRKYHMEHVYAYYGSSRNPKLKISNKKWILEQKDILMAVVNQTVSSHTRIYPKVIELLRQYSEDGKPESLIRLYTLETLFYSTINQSKAASEKLATPVYNALALLAKRAYKGDAYRGLALTNKEIDDYRWAAKVSSRVLIFNTFSSMSKDREIAREFAIVRAHPPKIPVVMTLTFPKRCLTTVQLERLSPTLPAIAENEDEREILILPRTAFYVEQVIESSAGSETEIHLKHCSWLDHEVNEYYDEYARVISMY